jgi:hypothetical protein
MMMRQDEKGRGQQITLSALVGYRLTECGTPTLCPAQSHGRQQPYFSFTLKIMFI